MEINKELEIHAYGWKKGQVKGYRRTTNARIVRRNGMA
jgi:hypothetical protein